MVVGRDDRRTPRASPSECAGSVETTRTRLPERAAAAAHAAAHVVLPTPPFPPMNKNSGVDSRRASSDVRRFAVSLLGVLQFVRDTRFDTRDFHIRRSHTERALPRFLDRADGCQHVALDAGEFVLRDLAKLEPHLSFEQLLA